MHTSGGLKQPLVQQLALVFAACTHAVAAVVRRMQGRVGDLRSAPEPGFQAVCAFQESRNWKLVLLQQLHGSSPALGPYTH
jgi:hypothetical protein